MKCARPIVTAGSAVLLYLALRREPEIAAFIAALTTGVLFGELVVPRLVAIFRRDLELHRLREMADQEHTQ